MTSHIKHPLVLLLILSSLVLIAGIGFGAWHLLSMSNTPDNINSPPKEDYLKTTVISGDIICLPHKNTSEPQTAECAIGLRSEDKDYYGLKDIDPEPLLNGKISVNKKVTVTGTIESPSDDRYMTIGDINVINIEVE